MARKVLSATIIMLALVLTLWFKASDAPDSSVEVQTRIQPADQRSLVKKQAEAEDSTGASGEGIGNGKTPASDPDPSVALTTNPTFPKDNYDKLEVVRSSWTQPDENGAFMRVRVVKYPSKYPLLRVEDHLLNRGGQISAQKQSAMVADHVMVKLADGFQTTDLKNVLKKLDGFYIRKKMTSPGLYLVGFQSSIEIPDAVSQLNEMGEGVLKYVEPDFMAQTLSSRIR